MTHQCKELALPFGEQTIAALTAGSEGKEIVLCVHGWLDNAASYLPFFNEMSEQNHPLLDNYHFIAIDWPGHGKSFHRSADAHYHFIDWSYDLLLLIESNQWSKVSIIGHSMGGMVASAFASAFNDKVNNLILIEAIGLLTGTENPSEQLRKGMQSRLANKNKRLNVHKDINQAVIARMTVSDLKNDSATLLVQRGLNKVDGGYSWSSDARLRNTSPQRYSLKQAIQIISNIHCPVSVIVGDNGFDMVQTGIKVFAEHYSSYQQFTLKGGHHPHMESVSEFIDICEQQL
ncbi:alpha/beta fold hydrolase [Thalassotalea crassostreae]|uniref:alpha/beta fold hydrolase n=1 Tax=Thalassotalea crassostreae TaxID=1763536 RepID=UPI0008390CC7|nr:alpha/beta hydrolase [Thalassotalea crassostreae]